MNRRQQRRALPSLLLSLGLGWACATPATAPSSPTASPASPSTAAPWTGLGRDFFARQAVVARIRTETGEEVQSFEIALQSRCGELRVVGLTGFGVRLFSAVRNTEGLHVEALGGRELPFPPERVLRDVEWTFFHSSAPAKTPNATDPVKRVIERGGESVTETWQGDRLVARHIPVTERPGAPPLEILYRGALHPPGIPERIQLSNPAIGYALDIRNHQVEELSCVPNP